MVFKFDDVSYNYSDGTVGLAGITGSIAAGDRVALVGANGSGKSTLLRILNGLIEPTGGCLEFDGRPVTDRALREASFQMEFRLRVGFIFQDPDSQLFNATVAEEVAFTPSQLGLGVADIARRVEEILGFLGIGHLSERAPFRLSGGEKRKVAIASVLAANPQVILLDEPFVGLDPRSQAWLISTLRQLQGAGKTTIVATHSLSALPEIADRALVLSEDHHLLGDFSVRDLLTDRKTLTEANLIFGSEPAVIL